MENYQKKADENMVEMKKENEAINKSARAGFCVTTILLLILNFLNVHKYGVQEAITMPSFIIMIIATIVWSLIYAVVMSKKK